MNRKPTPAMDALVLATYEKGTGDTGRYMLSGNMRTIQGLVSRGLAELTGRSTRYRHPSLGWREEQHIALTQDGINYAIRLKVRREADQRDEERRDVRTEAARTVGEGELFEVEITSNGTTRLLGRHDAVDLLTRTRLEKGASFAREGETVVIRNKRGETVMTVRAAEDLPTEADVVDAPHVLHMPDGRTVGEVTPERVRKIVRNLRMKRVRFSQDAEGAICVDGRRYVPVREGGAGEGPQGGESPAFAPRAERVPVSDLHPGDQFVTHCCWKVLATDGRTFTAVSSEGRKIVQTVEEGTRVLRTRRAVQVEPQGMYVRRTGGLGLGWTRRVCEANAAAVRETVAQARLRGDAVAVEEGGVIRVEGAGVVDPGNEGAGGRCPVWFVPVEPQEGGKAERPALAPEHGEDCAECAAGERVPHLYVAPMKSASAPHAPRMVATCCSCGEGIEKPLNGPRPACTHEGEARPNGGVVLGGYVVRPAERGTCYTDRHLVTDVPRWKTRNYVPRCGECVAADLGVSVDKLPVPQEAVSAPESAQEDPQGGMTPDGVREAVQRALEWMPRGERALWRYREASEVLAREEKRIGRIMRKLVKEGGRPAVEADAIEQHARVVRALRAARVFEAEGVVCRELRVLKREPWRGGQVCGHQLVYGMGAHSERYCGERKAAGEVECAQHARETREEYGVVRVAPGNALGDLGAPVVPLWEPYEGEEPVQPTEDEVEAFRQMWPGEGDLCGKCGRIRGSWPVERGVKCSPKDWAICIRP